jgi:hypothetical protein
MAFTRFHDDPARIEKRMLETTYTGIYQLNTPGNGKTVYVDTPHIRLQGGGSTLQTNPFEVNESLRRNKKLTKYDQVCIKPNSHLPEYSSLGFGTDESRTTLPAWSFRDKTQYREDYLFMDPQRNIWYKFDNNCPTRTLEKDHYQSAYY